MDQRCCGLALVNLVEAGIEVNALIHDGIIVHLDRKKFRKQFIKTKKILRMHLGKY